MGIEVQAQSCLPSQTAQFTFQEPIQSSVVGLTFVGLTYGPGTNHWVQTYSVSLETNMQSDTQLDVTLQATLTDHDGDNLSPANSPCRVSCIAVTGSSDPGTALANVTGVTPQQSYGVQLPGTSGSSLAVCTTWLSGFALGYDGTDHRFQGATAGSGINPQSSGTGLVTATAKLWDGSGNQATTTAIDAGVLASTDDPPPVMIQRVTVANREDPSQYTPPLTFSKPVSQAVALIQSFDVQYASYDKAVQWISVGCGHVWIDGSTVIAGPCQAWSSDGDGNVTSDSLSSVTLLVVAVPAVG